MPFLDHLEELRKRILWSLVSVILGFAIGLWLVNRFDLVGVIKGPIAPLLPSGQLMVTSPTEPLMITLKLGFITGLVLASPVILWQLWAFLSPALYAREKKTLVPALFVGMLLFLSGGVLAFVFVVPQALRVLLGFQQGSFATMITFENYFSFVIQLVLALGLSFELPLLMIILAALGILRMPMLNKIRPYAIVGSFVAGAVLSPGADVLSMFMLTIPLLFLFEIGVVGVWAVQRRRDRAAKASASAAGILLLCCLAGRGEAQQPVIPNPPQQGDTIRPPARQLDTASARRLGLPSAPRRQFPAPDSIIQQLLKLRGYAVTRYQADTASVENTDRRVELRGNASTERSGAVLEAKTIRYQEGACLIEALGEPHFFQGTQVLIGTEARFNTCIERGVVREALTTFPEQGANWFVRGNLAVDSSRSRLYGGAAEMTSCDLPIPHYHFQTGEVKWVSQSVIVARPAVLYVRDVPILWVPFLFQDTKAGRRSGILIPQFGFNDIVRNQRGYNRQVSNIGYYWAPNDYMDAQVQMDWFSRRYLAFNVSVGYKIRNRFLGGSASYTEHHESGGSVARSIDWRHMQQFNVTTSLNLDMHYSTNSSVIARNSIDPLVTTQQISSNGAFVKRFPWGQFTTGLTRRENITDGSGEMTLPTVTLTPKPLDFGTGVTWSPSLNFNNRYTFKTPLSPLLVPGGSVRSGRHRRPDRKHQEFRPLGPDPDPDRYVQPPPVVRCLRCRLHRTDLRHLPDSRSQLDQSGGFHHGDPVSRGGIREHIQLEYVAEPPDPVSIDLEAPADAGDLERDLGTVRGAKRAHRGAFRAPGDPTPVRSFHRPYRVRLLPRDRGDRQDPSQHLADHFLELFARSVRFGGIRAGRGRTRADPRAQQPGDPEPVDPAESELRREGPAGPGRHPGNQRPEVPDSEHQHQRDLL